MLMEISASFIAKRLVRTCPSGGENRNSLATRDDDFGDRPRPSKSSFAPYLSSGLGLRVALPLTHSLRPRTPLFIRSRVTESRWCKLPAVDNAKGRTLYGSRGRPLCGSVSTRAGPL